MKYFFILLFLIGCSTQPIKYFPEGTQGNSVPFYNSKKGLVCSKTGEVVHYFKITNQGKVIGIDYYNKHLKSK